MTHNFNSPRGMSGVFVDCSKYFSCLGFLFSAKHSPYSLIIQAKPYLIRNRASQNIFQVLNLIFATMCKTWNLEGYTYANII